MAKVITTQAEYDQWLHRARFGPHYTERDLRHKWFRFCRLRCWLTGEWGWQETDEGTLVCFACGGERHL